MKHILDMVLSYDGHRNGKHDKQISVTTLIGAKYQAMKALRGDPKERDLVANKNRIGAALGSGFHLYCENALADNPDCQSELYGEREINGVWITGTFDLLYTDHSGSYIMDFKTTMDGKFSNEQLEKTKKQLSLYRWLNPTMGIADTGYVLTVGRSRNVYASTPVELMSLQETEDFILNTLYSIQSLDRVDCKDNIKWDPKNYCEFICEFRDANCQGGFYTETDTNESLL